MVIIISPEYQVIGTCHELHHVMWALDLQGIPGQEPTIIKIGVGLSASERPGGRCFSWRFSTVKTLSGRPRSVRGRIPTFGWE